MDRISQDLHTVTAPIVAAVAGDASTGTANQLNSVVQSGSNVNSQSQTLIGGSQVNSSSNVTIQSNTNQLDDIGGDVVNSVGTHLDDHSHDDSDDVEGDADASRDNDGIDGNDNAVNLGNPDGVIVGLMRQLLELLRPFVSDGVSMTP